MVCINRNNRLVSGGTSHRGSRVDFVKAIRALGAKTALEGHPTRTTHPRSYRVVLSCSLEDWARTLGEPNIVSDHRDTLGQLVFQAWMHRCSDGRVLCIGRQYRRSDGTPWITVTKLYLF